MNVEQATSPQAPPRLARWLVWTPGAALGVLFGAGLFTFDYAEGASYLRDDPRACVNCHIMRDQYEGWQRGPHRYVATCNDCHTGHTLASKFASKAVNGFNHSWAFTTGRYPEPIQITAFNRRLAEASCRQCHGGVAHTVDGIAPPFEAQSCLRCHMNAGH